MIHCEKCGVVPVDEKDLPVLLPEGEIDFIPKGRSPLEDIKEFIETTCPKCTGKAKRDPDTMDVFVCSSWYHLRYPDANNDKEPFSKQSAKEWLPVDKYIGGIEHATGHLLYFRFFTKFLYDINWLPVDEPAIELFNHGMVLDAKGEVMSKSKGNVVSPLELMDNQGVDVSRIAMYFSAPSEREVLWTNEATVGASRFMSRIYRFAEAVKDKNVNQNIKLSDLSGDDARCYKRLHQTIKKVTEDIQTLQLNTAIASMMEFLNEFQSLDPAKSQIYAYCIEKLAQILAPFAPHLSEEIWESLGHKESIFKSTWPEYDKEAIVEKTITFVVQVNGKLRANFEAPVNISEEKAKELALSLDRVKPHLQNKQILKTIFVPNKLINIVVR
jgi:leucyl-tRNA synthetase